MLYASDGVPQIPGLVGVTLLFEGPYATVYRAVQVSLDREVTVKVGRNRLVSRDDQRRFVSEAEAANRMSSHPHVVSIFDAGVTGDSLPYLVTEVSTGSYADRMRSAALVWTEVCDVGFKIADALATAHTAGVLHRDVRPANLLVTEFGQPALADFGLAVLIEGQDSSAGARAIAPAYASPEMLRLSPPTAAMDVYALSATLHALTLGRPPRWSSLQSPSLRGLLRVISEPVKDIRGVPAGFTAALRAGMANDPLARPSAAELCDLLAAIGGRPAQAAALPQSRSPLDQPLTRRDRIRPSEFEDTLDIVERIRESRRGPDDGRS